MGWTKRDFAETFQRMLEDRYREVGRDVKRRRLLKGLSQEELAHQAGVSYKTISRVEKGGPHESRGGTFRKIAEALDVRVEVLLEPLYRVGEPTADTAGDAAGHELTMDSAPLLDTPAGRPTDESPERTDDEDPGEDSQRAADA